MIDWSTGSWLAPDAPAQPDAPWRMTVAADWAPIRRYEPLLLADPTQIYGDLLPLLRESDLNVVNVEALLGTAGTPIPKAGPHLTGDPGTLQSLLEAPFHIACLANNHILDLGPEGLRSTLNQLETAGLQVVGAGMTPQAITRPAVREVRGARVAIVNCADGESGRSLHGEPGVYGLDAPAVCQQIRELRRTHDVVIVIFHGGREYAACPPPFVVRDLRHLAAAGATAVIAHHPHVPQPAEVIDGVPIFYSQGNFVFWQEAPNLFQHLGYLVHLDFDGPRLIGCGMTPYALTPAGLQRLEADAARDFFAQMAEVAALLPDADRVQAVWEAFVDERGAEGPNKQLQHLLQTLLNAPAGEGQPLRTPEVLQAAATLQNIFLTPAHSEATRELMRRITQGTLGTAPDWARDLVRRWLTAPMPTPFDPRSALIST